MPGASVEINANLARVLRTGIGMDFVAVAAAEETAEIMIDNISSTTGTGKAYKRGGVVHVASSSGNYPVVDSGSLKSSISVTLGKKSDPGADLIIESSYALDLELGTSKMSSRPFIRGSLNQAMSTKLPEIINKFINYLENSPGLMEQALNQYMNIVLKRKSSQAKENWKKRRGL
jgi:hypothetical protein